MSQFAKRNVCEANIGNLLQVVKMNNTAQKSGATFVTPRKPSTHAIELQDKDEMIQELEERLAALASKNATLEGSLAESMSKNATLEGLAAEKNYDSQVEYLRSLCNRKDEEKHRLIQEVYVSNEESESLERQISKILNDHQHDLLEKNQKIGDLTELVENLKLQHEDGKNAQMNPRTEGGNLKKRKKPYGK